MIYGALASDRGHVAPAPVPGPSRRLGEVPGQARDGCGFDVTQHASAISIRLKDGIRAQGLERAPQEPANDHAEGTEQGKADQAMPR